MTRMAASLTRLAMAVVMIFIIGNGWNALAGDFATREIIGFSPDGKLFAFEEHGRQDGSGFPYATIYLIDTTNDNWVGNSPFRVLIENESAEIGDARREAREQAGGALATLTEPGVIAATNQPLEVPDNPYRMVARPRVFNPPTSDRIEFRIANEFLPGKDFCKDWGETVGFKLIQVFDQPDRPTRLLHHDKSLPKSRGCPLDYRLADIVTYHPESGTPVFAVLILMEMVGFEGPDGRYLAVTGKLD